MPPVWLLLALNLGCLFAVGMGCHGELARQRPPTARLTEFYFFLSVGGVLGGVFNALVAPLIFSGLWEYPLVLLAACLMKPATPEDARRGGWPPGHGHPWPPLYSQVAHCYALVKTSTRGDRSKC
jgi:hypothetical protein